MSGPGLTEPAEQLRWRDLLGGRWAISVPATVIVVVIAVPFSSLGGTFDWGLSAAQVAAVTFAGSAALVGFLALVNVTILRNRRITPAPIPVVVAVWLLAGGVRRLAALATASALDGSDHFDLLSFVLLVCATATSLGLLATVFALHDAYRTSANDIADAEALLADPQTQSAQDVQDRRDQLIVAIDGVLRPELARLKALFAQLPSAPTSAQLLLLADRVDSQSRDTVRQISQRVGSDHAVGSFGLADPPRHPFRWRALLTVRVFVIITLALKAAFYGVWTVGVSGRGALPVLVVGFALSAGVLVAGKWIWDVLAPKLGTRVVLVTYGTYALVQIINIAVMLVALGDTTRPGTGRILSVFVFGLAVSVAGSLVMQGMEDVRAMGRWRVALLDQVQVAANERATEIATLERQIAQVLHGPVQGRLATVAVALRLSAEQGGDAFAQVAPTCERLLEQAGDDIASIAGPLAPSSASLTDQLDAVADQWRGFLTMTYDVEALPSSVEDDHELVAFVASTVGEAVTNASRHGHARTVHVVVEPAVEFAALPATAHSGGAGLRVIVTDDGRPPAADVAAGGGLQDVDRRGGRWWLRPSAFGGCELTVVLPHG